MRNFKGIIMSEFISKLTRLRYFLKIFSKVNMPHKPIASVGFDTSNIFMLKNESKYTLEYIVPFFHFFFDKIYLPPKR